jgi:phenylacetate-coenzyme A ligase PaaK-like adenylate-forming protein
MQSRYREFQHLLDTFRFYKNYGQLRLASDADINSIPLTTKADLEAFDIRTCPKQPLIIASTSGSTGKSALAGYSAEATSALYERLRTILYSTLEVQEGQVICNLFDIVEPFLSRLNLCNLIVPKSHLDDCDYSLIAQEIIQTRCTLIASPPHLLPPILAKLSEADYTMERIAFAGIKITDAFKTYLEGHCKRYVDVYGLTELQACAQRVYPDEYFTIIQPDLCHLEVLDEQNLAKDKGRGILLVTDFTNNSYPIVRYYTGDIVDLRRTDDGFQFKVIGRVGTFINIQNELINKNEILEEMEAILHHSDYLVEMHAVPETLRDYVKIYLQVSDMKNSKTIEQRIRERLGCECQFYILQRPARKTRTNKYLNIIDRRNDPVIQ